MVVNTFVLISSRKYGGKKKLLDLEGKEGDITFKWNRIIFSPFWQMWLVVLLLLTSNI